MMSNKENSIYNIKKIARNMSSYNDVKSKVESRENSYSIDGIEVSCWDDIALSRGIPGICILFAELDNLFPDEGWSEYTYSYFKKIIEILQIDGMRSASLFSGAAGIGISAFCNSKNGCAYQNFISNINDIIMKAVSMILSFDISEGVTSTFYDVIEGLSGILGYLYLFSDNLQISEIIRKCIRKLIELTEQREYSGTKIPNWYIPKRYQFTEHERKIYPQGNFNTSLSHGTAGILLALAGGIKYGIEESGQIDAIKRIIDFYKKYFVLDEENHVFWHGQISWEEYKAGRINNENSFRRDAWCYGNPGIDYALYVAATVIEDTYTQEFAIKNLCETVKNIHGIYSPTFCHGYAGILGILLALENNYNVNILQQEKAEIVKKIENYYDSRYEFGYWDIEQERGAYVNYKKVGLLDGCVGTCLTLLEYYCGATTSWNNAFLLI